MIHQQGLSSRLFGLVAEPLRRNTSFFVFMYVLGVVVSVVELPDKPDAKLYDNLWRSCCSTSMWSAPCWPCCPSICGSGYGAWSAQRPMWSPSPTCSAFGSLDRPSPPRCSCLSGETNGNEASEFLSTYINASVILSPVGWLLLIAALQLATALILPRLRKRKVGGPIQPAGMTRQARPWLEALLLGLIVGEHHHVVAQQARDGGHVLAAEHRRYRA